MVQRALLSLFLGVLVTLANAIVPSYIHVCGRKNPNFDKCVENSIEALRPQLIAGIPELEVPPIDPFQIEEVKIADLPSFKGYAYNVTVTGFSGFTIDFLHVDFEKQTIVLKATFKKVTMVGTYDIETRILVPLRETGPVKLSTENMKSEAKLYYKFVPRNGKTYAYFTSMNIRLFVEDYEAEIGTRNPALQQAMNQVLGDNHKEIIEMTRPTLERNTAENTLRLSNNICKHFTIEELIPDTE